ncbi:MAG: tRNA (guanosine(37)-N1)-methyltransferase TrmD [Chloroflexi bacterium]|nr:tRNA (guanosine(37)-N1)-methyltransferase TrmD [Chloroflexota bacterium]
MRFDVFTLFPGMFVSPFAESILRRALDAGVIELHTHNIRDYTTDKHHITDDYAYGGGGGMVMKPAPIFAAVEAVLAGMEGVPIILMSPAGRTFTHAVAEELAQHKHIALICGHYEGVDERVREHLATDEISIGDYVLTGGELPAMVIIDAVARQVPGVLPAWATRQESHVNGKLEYPHYTRPAEFRGWSVPEVLLSGDHANVERWRQEQSELRTRQRRQQIEKQEIEPNEGQTTHDEGSTRSKGSTTNERQRQSDGMPSTEDGGSAI